MTSYFYIKDNRIYFRSNENIREIYLIDLTNQIYREVFSAIEAWVNEFGAEDLDPVQTDWLSNCSIDVTYDQGSIEEKAVKIGIVRELFEKLVLDVIGENNWCTYYDY